MYRCEGDGKGAVMSFFHGIVGRWYNTDQSVLWFGATFLTYTKTKRSEDILDAAAELFAAKPFHEVRLDDIVARAQVGKGTVYLYWKSKEEVYMAIIRRGFAHVLESIDEGLPSCEGDPNEELRVVIDSILDFAFAFPGIYRLMRSGTITPEDADLQKIRRQVTKRIQTVIERGVATGELDDPHPELTAQYILSAVRGAFLFPPKGMTKQLLRNHLLQIFSKGVRSRRQLVRSSGRGRA